MKTKTKKCEYCNNEYEAVRSDQKYCAPNCKQNAYNERVKSQNKNIRNWEQPQQIEFNANRLQVPPEYSAGQKSIEKQVDDLSNEKKIKEKFDIEEFLKQLESDTVKRKIDSANYVLKNLLQRLLEIDQEEVPLHKVKSLFEDIARSSSYSFYGVPKEYNYFPFINNILIPKAKIWLDALKYSRERYIQIALPTSLSRKFTDILCEIK